MVTPLNRLASVRLGMMSSIWCSGPMLPCSKAFHRLLSIIERSCVTFLAVVMKAYLPVEFVSAVGQIEWIVSELIRAV